MYTLTSEDPKTNLSLIHLQNLQTATELSDSGIGLVESTGSPEPVTLTYDIEEEKVMLHFVNYPDDKPVELNLSDYQYILSSVILY